jgi:hypothetical protein
MRRSDSANDPGAVLRRFNEVFLKHDPAPLAELVAPECVIENTVPVTTGPRTGRARCAAST